MTTPPCTEQVVHWANGAMITPSNKTTSPTVSKQPVRPVGVRGGSTSGPSLTPDSTEAPALCGLRVGPAAYPSA
jgi:hypothetical protein